jgi:hypothetical protein
VTKRPARGSQPRQQADMSVLRLAVAGVQRPEWSVECLGRGEDVVIQEEGDSDSDVRP